MDHQNSKDMVKSILYKQPNARLNGWDLNSGYFYRAARFNEEEQKELREVFTLLDSEGRGEITPSAILKEMDEALLQAKNPLVYSVVTQMNPQVSLNFEQFVESCVSLLGEQSILKEMFDVLDSDKSVWFVVM
eukprot:TRINITY_DN6003_c0_g1_i11.p2 TRINITY_DN6003_c0_g1~~TRINITY_DN6003_c0_g1_i11.p2  ORF type:complete len:133 (+),score=43.70 TRINITY_DN6003_c0_g1_i11:711-1109(+)